MVAIAARTGQLLNIADIAKDTGVSGQTAEKWLSILIASNMVYVLKPFHNNVLKRLIKTPKVYFLDTGLASYHGNEIDLLIKRGDTLYPIEMKKTISCDKRDITSFKQLDKIPDIKRGEGCVVYMADDVFPITLTDKAIGVRYL